MAYQWYQGQSGDTSAPIQGATSSSYTTPAPLNGTTSYWVAVSNLVTRGLAGRLATGAPSATATIAPILHAPTCTLSLRGAGSYLAVTATAICTDPQQASLVTTLDWRDGPTTSSNGGTLIANHTYSSPQTTSPYLVTVTSTDTFQLSGTVQVPLLLSPIKAVFAGQTASVPISVMAQSGIQVSFVCTTVIDSNGQLSNPSDLGISCGSIPSVVTLNQAQTVTITIGTTGAATSTALHSRYSNLSYAFLLPVPIFLLLGARYRAARGLRTHMGNYLALFTLLVILLPAVSCGGGFTSPKIQQFATPAGSYRITVVDVQVGTSTSGFVQTTLIVPLTVSPTQ